MLVGRYLKTLFFSAARFFSAISSDDEDDLFAPRCGLEVEVVVGRVVDQEEEEVDSFVVSGAPSATVEEEEVGSCAVLPGPSAVVEEEVVSCAVSGVPSAAIEEGAVSPASSVSVEDDEVSCVVSGGVVSGGVAVSSGPSLANSGYSAIFSDSESDDEVDEEMEVSMADSSPGPSLKRGYSAIFTDSEEEDEDEDEEEFEKRFVEIRKKEEGPCGKKQRVEELPLSQYVMMNEMARFVPPPIPSTTPPARFIRSHRLPHSNHSTKHL